MNSKEMPEVRSSMKNAREDLAWKEVKTEHIIQDEWIDFRRSAYQFPDGSVFEPFYTYSRRDYVVIVASDEEDNYICVRQFRQGVREVTTEFPAGGLERTDGKEYRSEEHTETSSGEHAETSAEEAGNHAADPAAENALEAAKRELLEETGYESDEWSHLLTIPSNATIADNYAYLFCARNCRKVSGQDLDETEFLNVELHSRDEIEELIRTGGFQQMAHVAAWLLAGR